MPTTLFADRVKETTTTTGTGTVTLAGAATGFQTFASAFGTGTQVYYCVELSGGSDWEVGIGTTGSGTLARNTVLSSSNAGSLVSFGAGTKNVFSTAPGATLSRAARASRLSAKASFV